MTELLAKSPRGQRRLTLHQHLSETEQAAAALFRNGTRWAAAFMRFFQLPSETHGAFLLNLRVAALLHDVGKANSGFQDAMRSRVFQPQPYRHEHLSALLLAEPRVRSWLTAAPSLDVDIVTAAVLSHHLKADSAPSKPYSLLTSSHGQPVALHYAEQDIVRTFHRLAELLGLPPPPGELPRRFSSSSDSSRIDGLCDHADRFERALRHAPARRALCLAVKAALIAADSVASATFREALDLERWIEGAAHQPPLGAPQLEEDILQPRRKQLEAQRPGWTFTYHAFQEGAAHLGPRAVLLAGCGAGKTLAAWRWAEHIAATHEIGRVIFLYPTRGTATEGFRDYVGHAPEGTAELVHGTARYELEAMATNPDERPASLQDKRVLPDEAEARLFALGLWPKRYFSATVDQFLSFIENSYRGLCFLPALADSAIIFDEVHSYDPSMWRGLVGFLRHFDVPALCMTATLPSNRQRQLVELGLEVYPRPEHAHQLQDLEAAERHPRYQICSVASPAEALSQIDAELAAGHRVLWVVNTVARCQELAVALTARLGRPVLVYHSRFTLEDRKQRHRETVTAFSPTTRGPAVAVTTQVCEMSLDLDADVLVTEHAPVTSLVQRFGRAHRHSRPGRPPARILVYAPPSAAPYSDRDLGAVPGFLSALGTGPTSQRTLADTLDTLATEEADAADWTAFTRGAYFAVPGKLREEDDHTVPAILEGQIDHFLELRARTSPTDGLHLNVPRKSARPHERTDLPRWLWIAHGRYDAQLGYLGVEPADQRAQEPS